MKGGARRSTASHETPPPNPTEEGRRAPIRMKRKARISKWHLGQLRDASKGLVFNDVLDIIDRPWKSRLAMTQREKYVLLERIVNEKTFDDIGVEFHVSRERIQQIEFRAMRKLVYMLLRLRQEKRG